MTTGTTFQGLEIELHRHSGARVLRVVHPDAQDIDEHRHDWAYIGLFVAGRYREVYDGGDADMSGPCAVLHPAGRPHADIIGGEGLETLTVEFDRGWLRHHGFEGRLDRSRLWSGGAVTHAARALARTVGGNCTEAQIGSATRRFLEFAMTAVVQPNPSWLDLARQALLSDEPPSTFKLARHLELHPAWLARAYRAATGEGLQETIRRKRVERASALLRRSNTAPADVALATGFCDQSHMNRSFRAVLGRTPLQIRAERAA